LKLSDIPQKCRKRASIQTTFENFKHTQKSVEKGHIFGKPKDIVDLAFKTYQKGLTKGQVFGKPKNIVDLAFKNFKHPKRVLKKAMYLENQKK
jgi:hypothetical protein